MPLGVSAWIAMRAGAQALGGLRVPPHDPTIWGFQPSTSEHRDLQQRLTPHSIKTMLDAPKLGDRWKGVSKRHYLQAAGPPPSRFADVRAAVADKPHYHTCSIAGGNEMMWPHPDELSAKLLAIIDRQG